METTTTRPDARGRPGVHRVFLALLSLVACGLADARAAEVPVSVEVLGAKGQVAQDLTAGDLEVREGGTIVPIAGLAPAGRSRVVLYFDRTLSGSGTLKRAAAGLADLSRQLVALGEVEIVTASETPEPPLVTRDELVLRETLSRSALTDAGERRIHEIRQRVIAELRLTAPATAAPGPDEIVEIVTAGIEEEIELIRERQQQLIAWASERPGPEAASHSAEPALLMWIMDGYDLDPVSFYLQVLDREATRAVIPRLSRLATLDEASRRLARTLAALGWTVMPVAITAGDGETPGLEYAPIEVDAERGGATSAPGITLRPGSLFGRKREAEEEEAPAARLLEPRVPLTLLAEASGGEVITTDQALRDAVGRLAGRFQLTYRSSLRLEADSEHLEVRALRPGLTVRARRWVSRGIPEQVAEIRLGRLLAGIEADGGFDVAAVLRVEADEESAGSKAELEARLELRELETATPDGTRRQLADAVFRVTLAVAATGRQPRLEREVVRADHLGQLEQWRYDTSLEVPPDATEVAVLIEDLAGGLWGGRRATVVEGEFAADSELLPAPSVVEILPPDEALLRGRVKFETEVYDARVARVDFLLDDRAVESKRRPPFAARLDLGRTPRRRTLAVVAYDAAGGELGRDSVVLNGGGSGLGVEIVRPANFRGTGWVEVEAEVAVPLESRLDRVVFYWNAEQVATLYSAPFRQRVLIPEDKPVGYVRVLALLDDGTVAEDVAFMNGPAHGERLDVNLVELYVVVTDPNGRPVRGLDRGDFQVREDGVRQEIATFSDASDLPLTLGMAIDSSASMFVKLPTVQNAAIDFLHSTFTEQDRAFVVDFDSEPRLARGTTGSLEHIVSSIGNLEANGRTALWESIVFSLVQLQGVRGRKALIVFSDGSDEDDRFPFRSSLSVAKKMGVPIYLILMRKEPKKEAGLSLLVRSFSSRVNRLVEATGGRVFYAKEYDHLRDVYEDIEHELRSQYLLAYYSREPSRDAWRAVDVDVDKRGLKPRTLSGYWQ